MRKKVFIRGPALSRSGYGEQTRFALRSLKRFEDRFDIYLINTNWGQTSWLSEDNDERRWIDFILRKTIVYNQGTPQYDISIQVTIPNEWEAAAPTNIGFTAGIESTKITPVWIEKANLMDKIFVVSNHARFGFENTSYTMEEKESARVIPNFRCDTPVTVTNFPVRRIKPETLDIELETDFNFVVVAQHGPRKNLFNTMKWFVEEFKDNENVGLVLKIFSAGNHNIDREGCRHAIEDVLRHADADIKCKLYLLHGEMSDEELHGLYTHPKIKCLINLAHGEGFGLPLFEATCMGLPVMCPDWGGQTDFLYAPVKKKKTNKIKMRPHFCRVEFDIGLVQKEAHWEGVMQPDSMWVFPKEKSYKMKLQEVVKDHKRFKAQAKKLQKYVLKNLAFEKQSQLFADSVWVGEDTPSVEQGYTTDITTIQSHKSAQVQTFE